MEKTEPSFSQEGMEASSPPPQEQNTAPVLAMMVQLEEARSRERAVLDQFLADQLKEQRSQRRGRALFRFFIAAYLIVMTMLFLQQEWGGGTIESLASDKGHTALVNLEGIILANKETSAKEVIPVLQEAFSDKQTQGVVIRINSPGGSPVQAGMIYDELRRLQTEYPNIPLYAALEDICASGGYYVAAAAPKIYADKASLVGSIGVIMQTFGLQEAIGKLGVENRTLTAGKNKAFLDPFGPVKPEEKGHAEALLQRIHSQFINAIKTVRGDQLRAPDSDLFNGLIWTGEEAVKLGLVDGLGSVDWIAREQVKAPKIVEFKPKEDLIDRLLSEDWTASTVAHLLQGSLGLGRYLPMPSP
jgi:protease-4